MSTLKQSIDKLTKERFFDLPKALKDILNRFKLVAGKVKKCKVKVTTDLLTSGQLVKGNLYQISTVESGDNFSNVGYVSGSLVFKATGTTPTSWSNGTEVLEYTLEVVTIQDTFDTPIKADIVKNGILTFTANKEFNIEKTYLTDTFTSTGVGVTIVDSSTIETDIQAGDFYKYYTIEVYD